MAADVHTALGLALTALLVLPNPAFAGDRYWDGGSSDIVTEGKGASNGGAGTWNTTLLNWDQGNGMAHVAWTNANDGTAIFGDAAGTVTLDAGITFGGLKFTAFGYVLSGNTLALGGGENRFQLGGGDDLPRGFTLMGSAQVHGQPRSE